MSISLIDIERMLSQCIPGGGSCDPQKVADSIRRYCNAWDAQPERARAAQPPREQLTDEQIDASTDAQWGKGCAPSQYMAHRAAARAIERLVRGETES